MDNTICYKNKYGVLKLAPIEANKAIRDMKFSKDLLPYTFDIDTAERIALITDNRGIQLAMNMDYKVFYVTVHTSTSTGF